MTFADLSRRATHSTLLLAALLLVTPFALYSGSLRYPMVFDDIALQESNLREFGKLWRHLDMRWVSYDSFGWTYGVVGTDLLWFRLGNVVLHASTVIALFFLFRRLFAEVLKPFGAREPGPGQLAFFGALLFALHPMSVYGVAYLVERSTIMATLFGVLSLHAYLEGLTRGGLRWFAGAAALYFLAVFSKEACVMLPAVAMALTLLLRKPSWSLASELWRPFAMFAVIGALIIFRMRGIVGEAYEPYAQEALARARTGALAAAAHAGGGQLYLRSVVTECWLFFKYLLLWIVPNPGWMAVDLREKFAGGILSWPETAGFLGFVLYGLLATRLLLAGGRRGLVGFGLLFPWLLYMTEVASVRIQEPFVLYRAYLWMAGFAMTVPLLCPPIGARPKAALLGAICLAMVPLALNRLDSFSSAWKLWNDVVEKNTDKTLFFAERGYYKRGVASIALGNYRAAVSDFTVSLQINPRDPGMYLNRGMARMQLGDFVEALRDFDTGASIDPKDPDFYVNRGVIYAATRRYTEAVGEFDRALGLDNDDPVARFNRGQALRLMSRPDEGNADIRASCGRGYQPACAALAPYR